MAEPPEFWAFVLSNVVVGILGLVLAGLSALAYRRDRSGRSFAYAAVGFGAITVGVLFEAIYEIGFRGSYELGGRELLALHTVEGVLVGLGLAVLFYSVRQY